MFRKVMLATDGSAAADAALAMVKEMKTQPGTEVVVVHCRELTLSTRGGGAFSVHADEKELQSKIEQQVRQLGDSVRLRTAQSVVGGAAHALAELAGEEGADVIVAGTRGHTALGGLLVGSVTQRLLHLAPCPVLVVPAGHGAS